MKKIILPILFGLLFTINLQAQTIKNDTLTNYENNLREDYLTQLSFNLIDRFYDNENIRILLGEWLNLGNAFSLNDFENVFSEFKSRENQSIRNKIFTGMYKSFGKNDKELLYKNLYFITYNQQTANYWANYISSLYSSVNEKNNKVRYNEIWNIKGVKKNDKGTFKITKYEDWSCKIVLSIQSKRYVSFECDENKAKLKNINGDTLEIEYVMPELTDILIDILGNDTKFDYVLYEEYNEETPKHIDPSKGNKSNNYETTGIAISGDELTTNRKIVFKPKMTSNCKNTGTVKLRVQINKNGEVKNVRPLQNINPCLTHEAVKLAKLYKWEMSKNDEIETLSLEMVFK